MIYKQIIGVEFLIKIFLIGIELNVKFNFMNK